MTKEVQTFIQEILVDTLNQMNDKLLGSIINRVESIECDIHDKAIENADLKQEIDTILGQSEFLKNENIMLKLRLDKEDSYVKKNSMIWSNWGDKITDRMGEV